MLLESDQLWKLPPYNVRLREREAHIWRASLAQTEQSVQHLKEVLSREELATASRFRFERDRRRWIAAHAILRLLLAHYIDADPAAFRFGTNAYGKPFLAFPAPSPPFEFNLSHTGDLVLYAFASAAQVGIDIEYQQEGLDYEALARVSFSQREQVTLHALPQQSKCAAFFSCWTRKEAYMKARGLGLSLPSAFFDVSLAPGESAALLDSREDPHEVERWSMLELFPGPGYTGALVLEGGGWQVLCWQYSATV